MFLTHTIIHKIKNSSLNTDKALLSKSMVSVVLNTRFSTFLLKPKFVNSQRRRGVTVSKTLFTLSTTRLVLPAEQKKYTNSKTKQHFEPKNSHKL